MWHPAAQTVSRVLVACSVLAVSFPAHVTVAATMPLRSYADARNLHIGAAIKSEMMTMQGCPLDPQYCQVFAREYNMVVPENMLKFIEIHPAQGVYDFSEADALVAYAQSRNIKVRGHTLLWTDALPTWITNGNFTGEQLKGILQDHITTVVSHFRDNFPGVVTEWDVANEVITRGLGVWGRIGDRETVTRLAFEWAHAADPSATLYYNDYSNEASGTKTTNVVFSFVTALKQRGVPIHGVGMQGHFDLKSVPSLDSMKTNMARFGNAGFKTKFTEVDVRLRDNSSRSLSKQADAYKNIVTACVQSPSCTGVLTWGFTDKYSWIPWYYSDYGYGLPLDTSYNPKPAYNAMQAVLSGGN